ncbi:MAG TPA: glycoside hydrolase family 15 protein, partial [Verrucomicrobiae bacterium]|nr:glycoside hydrolase family 15 protein [Verrucomicrobiae bacterium]
MDYEPIENYGVIGDLHTAALVSMKGSIDFMCFPRFDSPTIFAALLDCEKGGRFQIAPASDGHKTRQRYFPDTNILLTRFLEENGVAEISDFMAIEHLGHSHTLVRRVKVVRGQFKFRMICAPRFNYGRAPHKIERADGTILIRPHGKGLPVLRLRATIDLKTHNGDISAEFQLRAGETASFILEEAKPGEESPSKSPDYVADTFKETMNFWLGWMGHSHYRGRWREMVNRSALTLKLLTSAQFGSIVASPTFGLPENIGGPRNWDYRYTWVRDASFTLYALMRLGYREEARAFMRWIEQRCDELKPGRPLQVMYRIDGSEDLPEKILRNFEGYKGSRPVRIGNAACDQLQLDICGELMDSVFIYDKHGEPISYGFWMNLTRLVEWVCSNWRKPDDGIWEMRGGARTFLYSRAMCWVAIDRAMKIAQRRSFPAPLVRWHKIRDQIYQSVYKDFWNPKLE